MRTIKAIRRLIALTLVLSIMISIPVFAMDVIGADYRNVSGYLGLIDFDINGYVYYQNNGTQNVYIGWGFSRVSNNSSNSVVTGINFRCYNPTGSYYDDYNYVFPTALSAGVSSYGFRYYETTIAKTGSYPCVVVEIAGTTNWDYGSGGYTFYFPQSGNPYHNP